MVPRIELLSFQWHPIAYDNEWLFSEKQTSGTWTAKVLNSGESTRDLLGMFPNQSFEQIISDESDKCLHFFSISKYYNVEYLPTHIVSWINKNYRMIFFWITYFFKKFSFLSLTCHRNLFFVKNRKLLINIYEYFKFSILNSD